MNGNRRLFSKSLAIFFAASYLDNQVRLGAAPQVSGEPKVPTKPFAPLTVNFVPGVFIDRYSDLGGVLDSQTGVIWGYEPFPSVAINGGTITFSGVLQLDFHYKRLLLERATIGLEAERPAFAHAHAIANQRTWRAPTVFEAREAVRKGLFTTGPAGCNLYYGSPVQPGRSPIGNVRWSISSTPKGLVHMWSPEDGGTFLTSKTSAHCALVVSKL